jgi:autotransporter-associated beta strand protein
MGGNFLRRGALRAFVVAAVWTSATASGQVSGSWASLNSGSWSVGANWSSNPQFPTDGGVATIGAGTSQYTSSSAPTIYTDTPVALSRIVTTVRTSVSFSGVTITLVGPGIFETSLDLDGAEAYLVEAGIADPLFTGTVFYGLTGSAGLTKTGPGLLRGGGNFTGGLYINQGTLAPGFDSVLGAPGGSVILNGGALSLPATIDREILVTSAGGAIAFLPFSGSHSRLNGSLTGPGTLSYISHGSWTLTADNPFTGTLRIGGGSGQLILAENGSLGSAAAFAVGGTLVADNGVTHNSDRIGDTIPITLRGGGIELRGATSLSFGAERVGTIFSNRGTNYLVNNTSSIGLVGAQLVRQNRSTVVTSGSITLDTPPLLVGGGGASNSTDASIVPWAFQSSHTAELVTYDSGGLHAVGTYLANIPAGSVTSSNVRLTSGTFTPAAPATINALVIGDSTVNLTGPSTITISSGVILNTLGTTTPNRRNTISAPIDFGAAEGLIHISQGTLDIAGSISGSNGLTISESAQAPGLRAGLVMLAAHTYTGTTTVNNGDVRFGADVLPGVPGPFGADSSPIILNEGAGLISVSTTVFARDLVVRSELDISTTRYPTLRGANVSGDVALDGILGADLTAISGSIGGPGLLKIEELSNFPGVATLTGNNSFTGGVINRGTLYVGSDTALGTGTPISAGEEFVATAARLIAVVGPRTLHNPVTVLAIDFAGSFSTTLSGPVKLNGGKTRFRATNAPAFITGPISGGHFAMLGGRITLSGDNSQYATTVEGGTLTIASNLGLGNSPLLTEVIVGGRLELLLFRRIGWKHTILEVSHFFRE